MIERSDGSVWIATDEGGDQRAGAQYGPDHFTGC